MSPRRLNQGLTVQVECFKIALMSLFECSCEVKKQKTFQGTWKILRSRSGREIETICTAVDLTECYCYPGLRQILNAVLTPAGQYKQNPLAWPVLVEVWVSAQPANAVEACLTLSCKKYCTLQIRNVKSQATKQPYLHSL